jgi:hypothetical protein
MTYTYAVLEVSPAAYVEVERKLREAGYEHAIAVDGTIDLHGIALERPRRHANSCSNQNVLDPLGAYKGVEECGCNRA